MVLPKHLAHLWRLKPCIDKNPVCVSKIDQTFVIVVVLWILVPSGDMHNANSKTHPLLHQVFDARCAPISGLKIYAQVLPTNDGTKLEIPAHILE